MPCAPPVLQGDASFGNNDRTWGSRSAVTGGAQGQVRLLAAKSGRRAGQQRIRWQVDWKRLWTPSGQVKEEGRGGAQGPLGNRFSVLKSQPSC